MNALESTFAQQYRPRFTGAAANDPVQKTPAGPAAPEGAATGDPAGDIAELIAAIYASATPAARVRLLEYLLRPLGVLSILAVADGVFGRIWFRHGWCEFRIRPEDIGEVRSEHVVALVQYVLQCRAQTIHDLPAALGARALQSRATAVNRLWDLLEGGASAGRMPQAARPPVRAAPQAQPRHAATG